MENNKLFNTMEEARNVLTSSGSSRPPEASGGLAPSAARPLSEKTHYVGLFSDSRDSRDTIEEEWRDIPGYEGQYQASSYGRIRSLDRTLMYKPSRRRKAYETSKSGQLLKPIGNKRTQYQAVFLNGKRIDIHRLVTAAFYGPCPQGNEVLHRNGNRQDNRIENLAYGTHSENVRDTYRYGGKQQKLAAEDVEAIRFGLSTGLSMKELAGMYQISISNVSRIKTGSRYGWLKPEMLSANLAV